VNHKARIKSRRRPKASVDPRRRRTITILAVVLGVGAAAFAGALGAGIALEGNNAFCASCHTQPEQTYYQRTRSAALADLATFHITKQARCIDCHSGPGFIARSYAVIADGAFDAVAFYSGHYTSPAVTTRPLGADACTKCHNTGAFAGQTGGEGGVQGHYHLPQLEQAWQQSGGPVNPCATCHPAHPQIGDANTLYTSQDVAQGGCGQCHGALGVGG
jgi:hypothetical protein